MNRSDCPSLFNVGHYQTMFLTIPFVLVRSIILALLVGSQLYLFLKGDRALRRSRLNQQRKRQLRIALAGFFVSILCVYLYLLFRAAPLKHLSPLILYGLIYPTAIWSFGSVFSFLFLLSTDLLGRCTRLIRSRVSRTTQPSAPAFDSSRRRFMQAGLRALAATPVMVSGYGALYESNGCRIEEVRLSLDASRRFDPPLKVVQVSDIHSGLFMTPAQMRHCAETVQQLQPDLFVLTGDFISNSVAYLSPCVKEMARVQARYGSFAVLGNHEHWYAKPEEVFAIFEGGGIPVLQNAHRVLETDRGPVALVGIDDLRFGLPDLEQALEGLDPKLPRILLSHRPEVFPQAAAHNIALTLSGHYHGGQIKVSLLGVDFSLAHLLSLYPEGLYRLGHCHLYVNRGLGTTGTPVRLNAPPEITLFHLS
ncbi:MAG: metallophosphoesterase [candidate division NC10 bacterium]|nr:metallophosphoesterase [candidate division NC10 bacterium]